MRCVIHARHQVIEVPLQSVIKFTTRRRKQSIDIPWTLVERIFWDPLAGHCTTLRAMATLQQDGNEEGWKRLPACAWEWLRALNCHENTKNQTFMKISSSLQTRAHVETDCTYPMIRWISIGHSDVRLNSVFSKLPSLQFFVPGAANHWATMQLWKSTWTTHGQTEAGTPKGEHQLDPLKLQSSKAFIIFYIIKRIYHFSNLLHVFLSEIIQSGSPFWILLGHSQVGNHPCRRGPMVPAASKPRPLESTVPRSSPETNLEARVWNSCLPKNNRKKGVTFMATTIRSHDVSIFIKIFQ